MPLLYLYLQEQLYYIPFAGKVTTTLNMTPPRHDVPSRGQDDGGVTFPAAGRMTAA